MIQQILLSNYYVSGNVLGARDIAVNKQTKSLSFTEFTFYWGETNKYTTSGSDKHCEEKEEEEEKRKLH